MRLKIKDEIDVPENEPFKNDLFKRKSQIERLTKIASTVEHPYVLCLNGSWGSGKTTFIKLWKQHLEDNGNRTVYYNAWQNDFSQDPFVDIVSEIANHAEERKPELLEKAKKLGSYLLRKSLPAGAKLLSAGLVDISDFADEAIGGYAEKLVEDGIDQYERSKESAVSFRKTLESLPEKHLDGGTKNLIFFVDELDRCRPTYAVEVLERIKHFFNVNGIIFVLSLDREQIKHSIKSLYGAGIDAESYLRKFIDVQIDLPFPEKRQFVRAILQELGLDRRLQSDYGLLGDVAGIIIVLDKAMKTNARELSQIINLFNLCWDFIGQDSSYWRIGIFIQFLKIKNPDLYKRYTNYDITPEDLVRDTGLASLRDGDVNIFKPLKIEIEFTLTEQKKAQQRIDWYKDDEIVQRNVDYFKHLAIGGRADQKDCVQDIKEIIDHITYIGE